MFIVIMSRDSKQPRSEDHCMCTKAGNVCSNVNHVTSIYCSAATKELLLRLEKYPHRLNFALGILEAHKVHFKHLKNLLVFLNYKTTPQPVC
jgi:hypothetical protein